VKERAHGLRLAQESLHDDQLRGACIPRGVCGRCVVKCERKVGARKNGLKMCQRWGRHQLHAVIARTLVCRASASNGHVMIGYSIVVCRRQVNKRYSQSNYSDSPIAPTCA
jgi:hypothetical protein